MTPTTNPAHAVQDYLASKSPVTWLFAGDSITQGAVHTRGGRDYTQLFKERLGELGRNEDIVVNTAVGGWTLEGLVNRYEDRVAAIRPQVLFCMFGTNDSAGAQEGLAGFGERYGTVLGRAARDGIATIVQTTVPMSPIDPERFGELVYTNPAERAGKVARISSRQQFLGDYVAATKDAATQAGVPCVDHFAAWMRHSSSIGQLTDGGFHPNEYGHRLIAHTLFSALGIYAEASWTCRLFVPVNR